MRCCVAVYQIESNLFRKELQIVLCVCPLCDIVAVKVEEKIMCKLDSNFPSELAKDRIIA